ATGRRDTVEATRDAGRSRPCRLPTQFRSLPHPHGAHADTRWRLVVAGRPRHADPGSRRVGNPFATAANDRGTTISPSCPVFVPPSGVDGSVTSRTGPHP